MIFVYSLADRTTNRPHTTSAAQGDFIYDYYVYVAASDA